MKLDLLNEARRNKNKPGDYYVCCPFCVARGHTEDTKYRLGVNVNKGVFHCFQCGIKGPLSQLQEYLDFSSIQEETHDLEYLKERLRAVGKSLLSSEPEVVPLDLFTWPADPERTPIAWQYLMSRGFTPEEVQKYQIRVGRDYFDPASGERVGRWAGRVVFPFFRGPHCVYAVGRSHTGAAPRYLNFGTARSTLLYGLERVQDRTAILCEGIVSAIAAERATGIPAVASLGKKITDEQADLLRRECDHLWLSLDADVTLQEVRKTVSLLRTRRFPSLWLVTLPLRVEGNKKFKDPDDYGVEYKKYFRKSKKATIILTGDKRPTEENTDELVQHDHG